MNIGVEFIKKFVSEDKINAAFDAFLLQVPQEAGYKNTIQISKEKDNQYWVHIVKMRYKMGQWFIVSVLKSCKIYDLIDAFSRK